MSENEVLESLDGLIAALDADQCHALSGVLLDLSEALGARGQALLNEMTGEPVPVGIGRLSGRHEGLDDARQLVLDMVRRIIDVEARR